MSTRKAGVGCGIGVASRLDTAASLLVAVLFWLTESPMKLSSGLFQSVAKSFIDAMSSVAATLSIFTSVTRSKTRRTQWIEVCIRPVSIIGADETQKDSAGTTRRIARSLKRWCEKFSLPINRSHTWRWSTASPFNKSIGLFIDNLGST